MKGLSRMRGNSHVRFLGEGLAVMPSSYPIVRAWQAEWKIIAVLFTKLSFVFSCDFPIFDGFSQNPLHETV